MFRYYKTLGLSVDFSFPYPHDYLDKSRFVEMEYTILFSPLEVDIRNRRDHAYFDREKTAKKRRSLDNPTEGGYNNACNVTNVI